MGVLEPERVDQAGDVVGPDLHVVGLYRPVGLPVAAHVVVDHRELLRELGCRRREVEVAEAGAVDLDDRRAVPGDLVPEVDAANRDHASHPASFGDGPSIARRPAFGEDHGRDERASDRADDLAAGGRAAIKAGVDAVLIPIGTTEQHGPHMPLDTDCLIARSLAVRAAERGGERGRQHPRRADAERDALLVPHAVPRLDAALDDDVPPGLSRGLRLARPPRLREPGRRQRARRQHRRAHRCGQPLLRDDRPARVPRAVVGSRLGRAGRDRGADDPRRGGRDLARARARPAVHEELATRDAYDRSAAVREAGLPWTWFGRYEMRAGARA